MNCCSRTKCPRRKKIKRKSQCPKKREFRDEDRERGSKIVQNNRKLGKKLDYIERTFQYIDNKGI